MLKDRVQHGAALLDRINPGWERRINLPRFQMQSFDRCTLGQLYGNYPTGRFVLTQLLSEESNGFGSKYGFSLRYDEPADWYPELTNLWRAEIRRRLDSASAIAVEFSPAVTVTAFAEMVTA